MAVLLSLASANSPEWPQWRGPLNTGMAAGDAPLTWGASDVRWQIEIPGRGHSTPVVAGNRMFLTTAVPTGKGTPSKTPGRAGGGADAGLEHRFDVLAIDRTTGKTLWQRTATVAAPHEGYHRVYGTPDRPIEVLEEVRTGDVVLVPHGYHGPSVAAPGYHMYYLNVMAGPSEERAWKIVDDPEHAWLRGTWEHQDVDPRLPLRSRGA